MEPCVEGQLLAADKSSRNFNNLAMAAIGAGSGLLDRLAAVNDHCVPYDEGGRVGTQP